MRRHANAPPRATRTSAAATPIQIARRDPAGDRAATTEPVAPLAVISSSAVATAFADSGRSAADRATIVSTSCESAAGTVLRTELNARGVSVILRAMIACAFGPVIGCSPAIIS